METFAWIGIGIAALLLALWLIGGITGLVVNPVGRALILAWTLIGIAAWAALGGIYLIAQAV